VQRFHTEAQHTASLEHPNIVPIYDLGEAGGSVFIAMRYIDGLSLQELLMREKQLPITRAIRVGAQIAEALDYAHGRGIIHRDVKPANVMIEQGDRATLTDFGIARVAGSSRLTTTGSIVGTPDYLSPEQARGSDVDPRTDLYSLAIVTYEMLAGRPPFQSDNPLSVVHAQIATMPPPVTQFNASVPPEVAAVLLRAMAKEPSQRFASCREFISAIRRAATAVV
jgi:serine/threonine protein kinase